VPCPFVDEGLAAGVAEHVGMRFEFEAQPRPTARSTILAKPAVNGDPPLPDKHEGRGHALPLQAAQDLTRAQGETLDRPAIIPLARIGGPPSPQLTQCDLAPLRRGFYLPRRIPRGSPSALEQKGNFGRKSCSGIRNGQQANDFIC
jgi:hypothetical protein